MLCIMVPIFQINLYLIVDTDGLEVKALRKQRRRFDSRSVVINKTLQGPHP